MSSGNTLILQAFPRMFAALIGTTVSNAAGATALAIGSAVSAAGETVFDVAGTGFSTICISTRGIIQPFTAPIGDAFMVASAGITAGITAVSQLTTQSPQSHGTYVIAGTTLSFDVEKHLGGYSIIGDYTLEVYDVINGIPVVVICRIQAYQSGEVVLPGSYALQVRSDDIRIMDQLREYHQMSPTDSYITRTFQTAVKHFMALPGFDKQ